MKLLSLNVQGGQEYKALTAFIEEQKETVAIFCFQEMFSSPEKIEWSEKTRVHLLEDFQTILNDFECIFEPVQDHFAMHGRVPIECSVGQAIFVTKNIPVLSSGNIFTRLERNGAVGDDHTNFPANCAYVRIPYENKILTIVNTHGISMPGHKRDTPDRIEQSRRIVSFVQQEKREGNEIIVCGDFNLFPDTESTYMIDTELENLIKKYNVETTRSKLHLWYGKPDQHKFADYTFISEGITPLTFSVPLEVEVSDHLPMIFTFK